MASISVLKVSLGQSKFQIQVWQFIPLIWATSSAGGLYKDIEKSKIPSSSLVCTYVKPHLFKSLCKNHKRLVCYCSRETTRIFDFQRISAHYGRLVGVQNPIIMTHCFNTVRHSITYETLDNPD